MFACIRLRVRSAYCTTRNVKHAINHASNPLINQSVRFYTPLYSSHGSRSPVNLSHRRGSDTEDRTPETAIRQSRRQKKLEKERARVQSIKKLSFVQYNRELSDRVKKYEDWRGLLLFLSQEMENTKYNKTSSQVWTSPNKKHEQWTGATIADIINRLIKLRKTRKKVLDDDDAMLTLNRLCVLVESSVPKLHDELDLWKHLFHPYLYLRECVDEWNVNRLAKQKAAFTAAREAKLRQQEMEEDSDVVSDVQLKRKVKELSEKNQQLRRTLPADAPEVEEQEEHPLSWIFKKQEKEDENENEAEDEKPELSTSASKRRGEPESVEEIMRRVSQKGSAKKSFDEDQDISESEERLWVSPTKLKRMPLEAEIVDDEPEVEKEIPQKKVKQFFGSYAPVVESKKSNKKVKKYFS